MLCSLCACSKLPGTSAITIAEVSTHDISPEITVSAELIPSQRTAIKRSYPIDIESVHVSVGSHVLGGEPILRYDTLAMERDLEELQGNALLGQQQLIGAPELGAEASEPIDTNDAAIALLEQRINSAAVVAPHDGVVVALQVSAGQAQTAGSLLAEVVAIDPIYVSFRLAANEARSVEVGDVIAVRIDDLPGETFSAEVGFVGPELHLPERSFTVWAALPNPKGVLKIGMRGFAEFQTNETRQAYAVPRTALVRRSGMYYVFAVQRQVAKLVSVKVIGYEGDLALVSGRLTSGVMVVSSGFENLEDGTRVDVR